jgi:hypothetical protein
MQNTAQNVDLYGVISNRHTKDALEIELRFERVKPIEKSPEVLFINDHK